MDFGWRVTVNDKANVKALLERQGDSIFVCDRRDQNLVDNKPLVTKDRLWRAMVCMRLTTLANAGPRSRLVKFQALSQFPLSYDSVKKQASPEAFILDILNEHRVGTHRLKSSKELTSNFELLEENEWATALFQCNRLVHLVQRETEAEVAEYVADKFAGFGPKQSRNVLQALGLTRYEIPIDSRVTRWLNDELRFPFYVTSSVLGDKYCYNFILDAICKLCEECEIFPCILDAAIFSVKDSAGWTGDVLKRLRC